MLSNKVLLLASPIAKAIADGNRSSIANQIIPAVQCLNNECIDIVPYTAETVIPRLSVKCDGSSQHHEVSNEISNKTANSIRSSLKQISVFLKPITDEIIGKLGSCGTDYRNATIRSLVNDVLDIKLLLLDDPIFDFSIFPTSDSNKALTYDNVGTEVIDVLFKLSPMSFDEFTEKFSYTSDEIKAVNKGCNLYDLYAKLTSSSGGQLKAMGLTEDNIYKGNNGTTINFDKVVGTDLYAIMGTIVILKRFLIDDSLLKYVNKISLDEFKTKLSVLIFSLEHALVKAKAYYSTLKPSGIVILKNEVKLPLNVNNRKQRVNVGYTTEALSSLVNEGYTPLELVIGYVLGEPERLSLFGNPGVYQKRYEKVIDDLTSRDNLERANVLINGISEVLDTYVKRFSELNNNFSVRDYRPKIEKLVNGFLNDARYRDMGKDDLVGDFFLHSGFIESFANDLGLKLASTILKTASTIGVDRTNIKTRKDALAVATIKVITDIYTGKLF